MRRSLAVAFVTIGMALAGCGGSGEGDGPAPDPVNELQSSKQRIAAPQVSNEDAATLAADNLALSVDLHLALRAREPGNFVYSQTSISTAFAMLYAGAAGNTATQMADALRFSLPPPRLHPAFNAMDVSLTTPPANNDPSAFQLTVANSIWVQQDFNVLPAYLDVIAENYGAGLRTRDFVTAPDAAREAINRWVADSTENQIPSLFPPGTINSMTRMVLANAVYFHGDWKVPFRHDSQNAIFHALTGDVSVPTMRGSSNAALWSGPGWNAGVLDYKGNTSSMIILVPDAGTFSAFEAGLTAESVTAILAGARPAGGADLIMPRFKFETSMDLKQTLSALGMPEAFEDTADFSGVNGRRDLRVQAVLHKAKIGVDEKGTTAAAATGIVTGVTSVPPTLVVDRPFIFFIRHNPTGAILFQGRVVNPAQ